MCFPSRSRVTQGLGLGALAIRWTTRRRQRKRCDAYEAIMELGSPRPWPVAVVWVQSSGKYLPVPHLGN